MGTVKLNGKNLEFRYNSKEEPVKSVTLNRSNSERETTNTSTPGDSKDFKIGRFTGTITVEADMYKPWGVIISGSTLTAEKRYRVQSGSIAEGGNTYTVGMLFESNGTGTATATNRVQMLPEVIDGSKVIGLYNAVEAYVKTNTFSKTWDTVNSTTNKTTGRGNELTAGRAQSEATMNVLTFKEDYSYFQSGSDLKTFIVEFEQGSGVSISGSVYVMSENTPINVNEMVQTELNLKYSGNVTLNNIGFATASVDIPTEIILERGSSTHKSFSGNTLLTSIRINNNAETGEATISYNFNCQGAITESIAN